MARLRGLSPRGERLVADAPLGHWRTPTFMAGLRNGVMTAPWVLEKGMDRQAFDICAEIQLAPTLVGGHVVTLDNLVVHRSQRAAQSLKARRA